MKEKIFFLLLVVVLGSGCKEFFEPSLEGQQLTLLAPANNHQSNIYKQTFWWSANADAIVYRLQVVSPNFDSIGSLTLDTLIIGDKFSYTLDPGKYQWRVRAENGSSYSTYAVQSFEIFPSSLATQRLQMLNPANTLVSAKSSVRYEWLSLFGATRYRLQADTNSFADSTKLVLNVLSDNLSFTQQLKTEGRYEFRARAENNAQLSRWSEVRYFIFDRTPPEQVLLSTPANKQSVSKNVRLQWNHLADADRYEVAVYKRDSVTLFSSYPLLADSNTSTFAQGEVGEQVLWRVRAIDKAGNKAVYSNFFSFTIQ